MSWNPYKRLTKLIAGPETTVGQVVALDGVETLIELVDGSQIRARGMEVTVGAWVYVKGGVIEGLAPALTGTTIEV